MRKLQRIFVAFAAVVLSFSAHAAEVTLLNRSGHTLCAAEAMTDDTPNGELLGIKGWRCIPADSTLKISMAGEDRFVSIVTETMVDFLATQQPAFPLAQLYVPSRWRNDYSILILAKTAGGYAFTCQVDSGPWTEWTEVGRMEDLDNGLAARGFYKALAWHLDADAISESVTVILH